MALLLDTENTVIIADNASDMVRRLVAILGNEPDDETLAYLAAAALGCDVLEVIITHTDSL